MLARQGCGEGDVAAGQRPADAEDVGRDPDGFGGVGVRPTRQLQERLDDDGGDLVGMSGGEVTHRVLPGGEVLALGAARG